MVGDPLEVLHFNKPDRTKSPIPSDASTAERFQEPGVLQLGLDTLRRSRADFADLHRVGRAENRQIGPEPNGVKNVVRAGDQLRSAKN